MCTSPPRRSTQAPSFNVSIGQVSLDAGGGGHGFAGLEPDGGFDMIGGRPIGGRPTTGGTVTGGTVTGGTVTGGLTGGTVTGGTLMGGLTTGGRVTGGTVTGGTLIGGLTIGGRVTGGTLIGGFTIGGKVMGLLGGDDLDLGFLYFGEGFPQDPQPRMGVTEDTRRMQMRRRA